jgi:hypothetical protein
MNDQTKCRSVQCLTVDEKLRVRTQLPSFLVYLTDLLLLGWNAFRWTFDV